MIQLAKNPTKVLSDADNLTDIEGQRMATVMARHIPGYKDYQTLEDEHIRVFSLNTNGDVQWTSTNLEEGEEAIRRANEALDDAENAILSASSAISIANTASEAAQAAAETVVDKIDYTSIAQKFNPEKSGGYAANSYVCYNSKIYKFKTDHTGEWTGTDVIAVSLMELITSFYGKITGNFDYIDFSDTSLWEQGGIDTTTGKAYSTSERVRTTNFYRLVDRLRYNNLGGAVLLLYCYDDDGNYLGYTASAASTERIETLIKNNPKITKFKLSVNYKTTGTPEDLSQYSTFRNNYILTESRYTALIDLIFDEKHHTDFVERNGNYMFFTGNDTTFSSNNFYNFHAGNTYKIYMPEDWSIEDPYSSHYKFTMVAYDSNDTLLQRFTYSYIDDNVESSYEITIPENTSYVLFGGRAAKDVKIRATFVDITETLKADNYEKNVKLIISAESMENQSISVGNPQHDNSPIRVITNDIVVFPTTKFKFKYKAPSDVWVYFAAYKPNAVFGKYIYSSKGVYNGEEKEIDVSSNAYYGYRLVFGRRDNANISAEEVKTFVRNGDIEIILDYETVDYDYNDQITRAMAVKKLLIGNQPWWSENPTFVHVSDLHGDATRLKNALVVANKIGADGVINSGDTVMYNHSCGSKYMNEIFRDSTIPVLYCIGNHESYPTGQTGLFVDNMKDLITPNGYLKSAGTPADDCYWYKDFDSKKIRIIALNYYNNGVYNGSLGQTQLNWFVTTLANTPENYGVLIEIHSPEDKIDSVPDSDKFYQKHRVVSYQENGFYVGDRPIMNIVDGFISKTSGTESYTDNGTVVTVNFDFTNVASGVEFIAYVVGHRHEDWIGKYHNSTNLQISLGITTSNAICTSDYYYAFSNQSDLPRNQGKNIMQDAINVYGIDRDKGIIKVARIGSDVTELMDIRDVMTIAYR